MTSFHDKTIFFFREIVDDEPSNDTNVKMDQLWKIALCAQNTDVSMKAIQILNSAYFGQGNNTIYF